MTIKFLTINILFGGKIWNNLISFINTQRPDILVLQEVYDGHDHVLEKRFRTMDEFSKEFGDFLPHSSFGATVMDTGVNIPWGNAIFSKFLIKNSRNIFFDLPYGEYNFSEDPDPRLAPEGMHGVELEVTGKSLFAYSWHGVWNNHGEDTPERKIMERAIISELIDKENVILAGDTNMNPTSGVIQNIQKETGLISVFGDELGSTFNMIHKAIPGNYANAAVDMIFVSKSLNIFEKEMPLVDVSDHYPLSATLEI